MLIPSMYKEKNQYLYISAGKQVGKLLQIIISGRGVKCYSFHITVYVHFFLLLVSLTKRVDACIMI